MTFLIRGMPVLVRGATLRLPLGASDTEVDFVLELETPHARLLIPGYCTPAPQQGSELASSTLTTTVEDSADVFDVDVGGTVLTIAPHATPDTPARLRARAMDATHVAIQYTGTFVRIDPSGERGDELVDVVLDLVADWDAS